MTVDEWEGCSARLCLEEKEEQKAWKGMRLCSEREVQSLLKMSKLRSMKNGRCSEGRAVGW